jgi:hypothetical protein
VMGRKTVTLGKGREKRPGSLLDGYLLPAKGAGAPRRAKLAEEITLRDFERAIARAWSFGPTRASLSGSVLP